MDGQSVDEYVTELKSRSEHCEFGELKNSLIKDKIVLGVNSKKVHERLLREAGLSLEKAIQICRAAENVKMQAKEIKGASNEASVEAVSKGYSRESLSKQRNVEGKHRQKVKNCKYCGGEHEYGKCPAYRRQCNKCGKHNHLLLCVNQNQCRSWTRSNKSKGRSVHQVQMSAIQNLTYLVFVLKVIEISKTVAILRVKIM